MNQNCKICSKELKIFSSLPISFCPYCGSCIIDQTPSQKSINLPIHDPSAIKHKVLFKIENYEIIRPIGKGGMGEIFLAYDPQCERYVAIKRIKETIKKHAVIYNRFIREAKITSYLTHPSIIPIHTINISKSYAYYTMTYVEGKTLRTLITEAKKSSAKHEQFFSTPSLLRVFLSICQAMAFSHSRKIIHRDLKPENIMIGQYGEVYILDWGLAKKIEEPDITELLQAWDQEDYNFPEKDEDGHNLTLPGKTIGTVSYMSPEKALLKWPENVQTDIYSLGVILYQLLSFQLPFQRKGLKHFKENFKHEKFKDPSNLAPYRDIPHELSMITKKCLHPSPKKRYLTIDEVIQDIEHFVEGHSGWYEVTQINYQKPEHWSLNENIPLTQPIAAVEEVLDVEWFSLMISTFSSNSDKKLQMTFSLKEGSKGIGLLIDIPISGKMSVIQEGYCFWLGSYPERHIKLYRSNVELHHHKQSLAHNREYHLSLIKSDNNVLIYLDNSLILSYVSYFPLRGSHIGLLYKDPLFTLSNITVLEGNKNLLQNCLAIPDAFLSHRYYDKALYEYRQICLSFPNRPEDRQARFKAGITLIEKANSNSYPEEKERLFKAASEEFSLLNNPNSGPLAYLGKSLISNALGQIQEEVNLLEIAFRKYTEHPLLYILEEQIIYRLHTCSQNDKKATYRFALLVFRLLPKIAKKNEHRTLFSTLESSSSYLPFAFPEINNEHPYYSLTIVALLAFYLNKPAYIEEIIDLYLKQKPTKELSEVLHYCLLLLCESMDLLSFTQVLHTVISNKKLTALDSIWGILEKFSHHSINKVILLKILKQAPKSNKRNDWISCLLRSILLENSQYSSELYSWIESVPSVVPELSFYAYWILLEKDLTLQEPADQQAKTYYDFFMQFSHLDTASKKEAFFTLRDLLPYPEQTLRRLANFLKKDSSSIEVFYQNHLPWEQKQLNLFYRLYLKLVN